MTRAYKKKYHYIYKTTCVVTGKYYIGMHSTDDLEDGYQGSGKRLWHSIRKHGKENHKTEILEFLSTREELRNREAQIINEELLQDKMCMNLQPGGGGGFSEESRLKGSAIGSQRMAWLAENDPEWVIEFRRKCKDRAIRDRDNGVKSFGGKQSESFAGKSHSSETKKKMSESHIGKHSGEKNSNYGNVWIHSMEEKISKRIPKDELESWLSLGWIKGRKLIFK